MIPDAHSGADWRSRPVQVAFAVAIVVFAGLVGGLTLWIGVVGPWLLPA